jgi:hypothetical protein
VFSPSGVSHALHPAQGLAALYAGANCYCAHTLLRRVNNSTGFSRPTGMSLRQILVQRFRGTAVGSPGKPCRHAVTQLTRGRSCARPSQYCATSAQHTQTHRVDAVPDSMCTGDTGMMHTAGAMCACAKDNNHSHHMSTSNQVQP